MPERERVRNKFAQTMAFVEDYLCNIVNKAWAEKEQNTLTFQVKINREGNLIKLWKVGGWGCVCTQ